ncbi:MULTISPECIES: hypothetical protein [Clostridioides]|uniref:hypothetical protein n=1 Tax=unclassified Clostridioides TaxID=2635829 RepID=UPI001D0C32A9|nr:hypothetical protein [Clostridioides sp. ZZV15-6388]MCC0636022.1 hypothetical protein [Clostridioides sp. ES-S-0001-02]MCC0644766.1 hypothetical protein [Clostridioides sp. ZZV14-6150]MCC0656732.1 hypothetical protein [Clostridioides sp. ES-S-0123-01]MCC0661504.1 hypothetical protein [Clostridioides sp. ZZV14-6154]MCC0663615.1 hypothetical protein [Clostridioides sp. ZZV15-6597]MCC0668616.1 hypothetical protein [Clostridioides sp. ZZV14-6153]MCC0672123.1 hypothetical protein [Clostridioid
MDQIKRLHELQQKSYLTKEEFEELKNNTYIEKFELRDECDNSYIYNFYTNDKCNDIKFIKSQFIVTLIKNGFLCDCGGVFRQKKIVDEYDYGYNAIYKCDSCGKELDKEVENYD